MVDPSATGRRLSTLGRRLHRPLLVREQGRIRISTGGWLLYRSGQQLIDVIDRAVEHSGLERNAASVLVPAMAVAVATTLAPDQQLADLLSAHLPGVVIDLLPASDNHSRFDRYEVDAAFYWAATGRATTGRRPHRLFPAAPEALWIALPLEHPAAGAAAVSIRDFAEATWAVPPNPAERELLEQSLRDHRLTPSAILTAGSVAGQRSLVAHGQAVALMSPVTSPRSAGSGFVLRPLTDGPTRELITAHHPDQHQIPPVPMPVNLPIRPGPPLERHQVLLRRIETGVPAEADPQAAGRLRLEPEHLTLLDQIRRAGSVNRAAAILLTTQPALIRRLRRLEVRLGVPLLNSSPNGTLLSEFARMLLVRTAPARAATAAVLARLQHSSPGPLSDDNAGLSLLG